MEQPRMLQGKKLPKPEGVTRKAMRKRDQGNHCTDVRAGGQTSDGEHRAP